MFDEWRIDQYNDLPDTDDDGNDLEWSIHEVTRDAHNFEGIIITLDNRRHDIPLGGGIVRTSSAQRVTTWKPSPSVQPPPGLFGSIVKQYMIPAFTDQVYANNIIMNHLVKQHGVTYRGYDAMSPRKPRFKPPPPKMPLGLIYTKDMPPWP